MESGDLYIKRSRELSGGQCEEGRPHAGQRTCTVRSPARRPARSMGCTRSPTTSRSAHRRRSRPPTTPRASSNSTQLVHSPQPTYSACSCRSNSPSSRCTGLTAPAQPCKNWMSSGHEDAQVFGGIALPKAATTLRGGQERGQCRRTEGPREGPRTRQKPARHRALTSTGPCKLAGYRVSLREGSRGQEGVTPRERGGQ